MDGRVAIPHERSRMPFANRIDPMSTSLSHTTVLYVVHHFALWIFCVFEYILGPTELDLSLKCKFSYHKYHHNMLNSDYSKCSAEIMHVLRSLVLDAFVPSRWPPFHESSLMAYALRFVFLLVNLVAFTSRLLNTCALYIITMYDLFFEDIGV